MVFRWTDVKHGIVHDVVAKVAGYHKKVVDTEARNSSLYALLFQLQHGEKRVIAYHSNEISNSERNCCVIGKRLLIIIQALEHFLQYL